MKQILMIHRHVVGFTLVEMAIVLMIVGLLLGGMLVPLSAQMEQRNISDTRKTLDEIQQALIGYAIINGRLPYPAKPTLITGTDANAGLADNTLTMGVIPWATLGTSETDAWGRRFTYSVAPSFATPFTLISNGNLTVKSAATGGSNVATNIPAVIVSHGKNGYGAYTPNGGPPLSTSPDADEADNSDPDVNFVSKAPTPTFDDLVVWISPNILFNRMVAAGKLP
jgi:prepilin-type N-terminal cleavage/methylation domain-containing protein